MIDGRGRLRVSCDAGYRFLRHLAAGLVRRVADGLCGKRAEQVRRLNDVPWIAVKAVKNAG